MADGGSVGEGKGAVISAVIITSVITRDQVGPAHIPVREKGEPQFQF